MDWVLGARFTVPKRQEQGKTLQFPTNIKSYRYISKRKDSMTWVKGLFVLKAAFGFLYVPQVVRGVSLGLA